MSEEKLEQLDEKIVAIEERLAQQVRELVDVITGDIPNFALKQVRKAFIEDVAFAEKQTDAQLSEFKANVETMGKGLSQSVRTSLLEDMSIWECADAAPGDDGKSLNGNPAVARRLEAVARTVSDFIVKSGLKAMEVVYRTPTYFINGKYAPGMIEKYWAELGKLREARQARKAEDLEVRRENLAKRWDMV